MKQLKQLKNSPALSGYILLSGAIILNIIVQSGDFFTRFNINSVLTFNTPLIIAAIAQTVVVLAGGIDLSVGSNMTLVNTVAIALANQYDWPVAASWIAALAAGTLIGVLNGFVVGYLRVPPLLATFASMSIVGGLALWVLPSPGGTIPTVVFSVYYGDILAIPSTIWIVGLLVLFWRLLARYPLVKYFRAVGSNERSAYINGINVSLLKLTAFTLCGFLTAVAGLCLTALTASGDPKIGMIYGLNSIAAVILGGASLSGGWGRIGGSISGALFLGLISNFVFYLFNNYVMNIFPNMGSLSSFLQQLLSNLIIIFGLASSVFTQRKRFKSKL